MGTPKAGHGDSDELSAESKRKIRDARQLLQVEAPVFSHAAYQARVEHVLEDMICLVGRGDGWMRWTSDLDGKVLFLKYKFTSIRWPNHYVFVSGPIWDVANLVAALVRKCEKVDADELVPTQDKPYNHM